MPVLAIRTIKSFGSTTAVVMRAAATNVTERVIPNSGHWLMEEQPGATRRYALSLTKSFDS
jgi:pimeloyl-ACP methyl ester carboxylesterase